MFARIRKRGHTVRYVQLAHNRRVEGVTQAEVLLNLGREDQLDIDGPRRGEFDLPPQLAEPAGLEPGLEQLEQLALLEANVVGEQLPQLVRVLERVEARGLRSDLLVLAAHAVGHRVPLLVAFERRQHQPLLDLEVAPAVFAPEVAKSLDSGVEIFVRRAA